MQSIKLISSLINLLKLLLFIFYYYTSSYVKMSDQVPNFFLYIKLLAELPGVAREKIVINQLFLGVISCMEAKSYYILIFSHFAWCCP